MKANSALIVFAVIYNIAILIFFFGMDSYISIVLAPVFFFISVTALGVLWYQKVIQINTTWDKLLFLFSTPVPLLIAGCISS